MGKIIIKVNFEIFDTYYSLTGMIEEEEFNDILENMTINNV